LRNVTGKLWVAVRHWKVCQAKGGALRSLTVTAQHAVLRNSVLRNSVLRKAVLGKAVLGHSVLRNSVVRDAVVCNFM
jgi:uncharacterized protein YjbI with pentapeptide repeats